MFRFRLITVALVGLTSVVVSLAVPVSARQTVILGTMGVGYDYAERTYDDDYQPAENEGDRKDYFATPEIEIQSLGIHDTISFRYAPVLRYDDLESDTDVDHYLVLHGDRFFTKDWNVALTDSYVLSSDPSRYGTPFTTPGIGTGETVTEAPAETPPEITQNLGKRGYWTNDLMAETTYAYAEKSDVGFGYAYRVLRDDSDDSQAGPAYAEYDRHEFWGLLNHLFAPAWSSSLELRYIKGLYDDRVTPVPLPAGTETSQDLEEYWATLGANYSQGPNDIYSLQYRYNGTQYEDLRPDIRVHELVAAWNHIFDARTSMVIGGGPSYVDEDELDGEWGYNAQFDFLRTYQRGDIRASINKRYEPRNFTGGEDTGLTDITDIILDASYQCTKDVLSSVFATYRYEDIQDPKGAYYLAGGGTGPGSEQSVGDVTYSRESYSVGARIDYTFLRWFVASLSYEYYDQEGDLIGDSYNDNRFIFQISASKELWRK